MSHYTTNLCVCVKGHVVIGIHEFVEEHIKCWISTTVRLCKMNLSDLLYPGNSRRRQDVIKLHQELLDGMQLDFKATNDLIGTLNKHLGTKMMAIKMKECGTVKENCDIIIQAMNIIQQEIQKFDKEIKERRKGAPPMVELTAFFAEEVH